MKKMIFGFVILIMNVGVVQAQGSNNPFIPRVSVAPHSSSNSNTYGSPFRGGNTYKNKCQSTTVYGQIVKNRILYKVFVFSAQCHNSWGQLVDYFDIKATQEEVDTDESN